MHFTRIFATAFALLLLLPAAHAEQGIVSEPIKAMATQSHVEGEVMVVDVDSRRMTLKLADGSFEVLHAPPEVKRLGDIRIGDRVSLTKTMIAVIELETNRASGTLGVVGSTQVERTGSDGRPGGSITDEFILRGQIAAVDQASGMVTIRGANGTLELEAEDKARLATVKVGDGVVVRVVNHISGEVSVN